MTHPLPTEYAPFSENYIKLASEHDDVIALLHRLKDETRKFFAAIPAEKDEYAYGLGKWTLKQVAGHMIDTERIFAYRAFCISRNEKGHLPAFEQDDYVNAADYSNRTLQSLADEFRAVRESNLYFIDGLNEKQIAKTGHVSDYYPTVKALLYMMAGHELYHLKLIKERYL